MRSSVSSGTVSWMFSVSSKAGARLSRMLAVTSMRSSACSISTPILLEEPEAETTTSEFFEDFTSMRPSATFWIITTGWPFTVKRFSIFSAVAGEARGSRNTPAPTSGRKTARTDLQNAGLRLILVHAPAALHHRGQNFCLLLISSGKIFARHGVVRVFFEALPAFLDEGIDRGEIFAQCGIHIRNPAAEGAGILHGPERLLFAVERAVGFGVGFGNGHAGSLRGRGRRVMAQLVHTRDQNQSRYRGRRQHTAAQKRCEIFPPSRCFARQGRDGGLADPTFGFQLGFQGDPDAGRRF